MQQVQRLKPRERERVREGVRLHSGDSIQQRENRIEWAVGEDFYCW